MTTPALRKRAAHLTDATEAAVSHAVVGLYDRHASLFDRDRGRTLFERAWLDRFVALVPAGGTVLDLGCGMGEPIARHLVGAGCRMVGVDAAPSMIARCRERFPDHEWNVADMRTIALGRQFDGILAWDSVFHLTPSDQRGMFDVFAAHARPGSPLMFTSGPTAGESVGEFGGEPLYHASLAPDEYRELLAAHGYTVRAHVIEDPHCGLHTIWLATRESA